MSVDHMKYLSTRDKRLNTVELKPCPFCGGRAIQRYDNHVYCEEVNSCGAGIDFGHWVGGNEKESTECRKAVAEAWNKRAERNK